jgi:hypothetical protein
LAGFSAPSYFNIKIAAKFSCVIYLYLHIYDKVYNDFYFKHVKGCTVGGKHLHALARKKRWDGKKRWDRKKRWDFL